MVLRLDRCRHQGVYQYNSIDGEYTLEELEEIQGYIRFVLRSHPDAWNTVQVQRFTTWVRYFYDGPIDIGLRFPVWAQRIFLLKLLEQVEGLAVPDREREYAFEQFRKYCGREDVVEVDWREVPSDSESEMSTG